jgi:hypothetical protein
MYGLSMTWAEICADKLLATLPYRIESDRWPRARSSSGSVIWKGTSRSSIPPVRFPNPVSVRISPREWSWNDPHRDHSGSFLGSVESGLPHRSRAGKFERMRTLSLEEAVNGLGRWLELAIEGEDIRIRKGNAMVELRPVPASAPAASTEPLSPREALRRLQAEARLTSEQAEQYLNEVQDERLAAEARRPE